MKIKTIGDWTCDSCGTHLTLEPEAMGCGNCGEEAKLEHLFGQDTDNIYFNNIESEEEQVKKLVQEEQYKDYKNSCKE